LTDGRPIQFEQVHREIGEIDAKKVKDRYGEIHKGMFGPPGASEEAIAAALFETARKVFLRDGYHASIFFLFCERKLLRLILPRQCRTIAVVRQRSLKSNPPIGRSECRADIPHAARSAEGGLRPVIKSVTRTTSASAAST
ncbi:MAG: hypothetical protein AABY63_08055, partial [candidate division NC10 bacterium]